MLNLKNFLKFWNLMVYQQSENLIIAPEVVRIIEHQQNLVRGRMPEMEFLASGNFAVQTGFFWVFTFVHHFSPVAVVFTFFWTWFLFSSEIFSFLQFSVLNLT